MDNCNLSTGNRSDPSCRWKPSCTVPGSGWCPSLSGVAATVPFISRWPCPWCMVPLFVVGTMQVEMGQKPWWQVRLVWLVIRRGSWLACPIPSCTGWCSSRAIWNLFFLLLCNWPSFRVVCDPCIEWTSSLLNISWNGWRQQLPVGTESIFSHCLVVYEKNGGEFSLLIHLGEDCTKPAGCVRSAGSGISE